MIGLFAGRVIRPMVKLPAMIKAVSVIAVKG